MKLGDLPVDRPGFGAMRVCGRDVRGEPEDRAAAKQVLVRASELGYNFLDTADSLFHGFPESARVCSGLP